MVADDTSVSFVWRLSLTLSTDCVRGRSFEGSMSCSLLASSDSLSTHLAYWLSDTRIMDTGILTATVMVIHTVILM